MDLHDKLFENTFNCISLANLLHPKAAQPVELGPTYIVHMEGFTDTGYDVILAVFVMIPNIQWYIIADKP